MREKVQSNMARWHFTLFHNLRLMAARFYFAQLSLFEAAGSSPIEENNDPKFGHGAERHSHCQSGKLCAAIPGKTLYREC